MAKKYILQGLKTAQRLLASLPWRRVMAYRPTALVLRNTLSALIVLTLLWVVGFALFVLAVQQQTALSPDLKTDVAVVLTGGSNRVETGFDLIAHKKTDALLVTGVHQDVGMRELIDTWNGAIEDRLTVLAHCCITIGRSATTTEENVTETAQWLLNDPSLNANSLRLVTSDYHMPRALILFKRAFPTTRIVPLPVKPEGLSMRTLGFWRNSFIEYNKFILTWMVTRL